MLTDLLAVQLPKESGVPGFFNPRILFMGKLIYRFDPTQAAPIEVVSKRESPMLFIHCEGNATISAEHSHRLWSASGQGGETLWLVYGCSLFLLPSPMKLLHGLRAKESLPISSLFIGHSDVIFSLLIR